MASTERKANKKVLFDTEIQELMDQGSLVVPKQPFSTATNASCPVACQLCLLTAFHTSVAVVMFTSQQDVGKMFKKGCCVFHCSLKYIH